MKNLIIYLSGPIEGTSWRTQTIKHFEAKASAWGNKVTCLDPTSYNFEDYSEAQIPNVDKYYIDKSDVMLVNVHRLSAGTSMEIMYSFMKGIPVFACIEDPTLVSPWHKAHCVRVDSKLEDTFDEMESFLLRLAL